MSKGGELKQTGWSGRLVYVEKGQVQRLQTSCVIAQTQWGEAAECWQSAGKVLAEYWQSTGRVLAEYWQGTGKVAKIKKLIKYMIGEKELRASSGRKE